MVSIQSIKNVIKECNIIEIEMELDQYLVSREEINDQVHIIAFMPLQFIT